MVFAAMPRSGPPPRFRDYADFAEVVGQLERTGLNLTAASTVIHLDPWWNPAVEDQASDRAHRIGQTRSVTVIRLVARGTIEETVLALHADKRELAAAVLEGAGASGKLSMQELSALIDGGARKESEARFAAE
jgi:hypothetical protein